MKYITLFIFLSLINTLHSQNYSSNFIIATGSKGGNYYKTGQYIAFQYNRKLQPNHFIAIETNGSNENINLLRQNTVDFAIVQRNLLIDNIYNKQNGIKNLEVIAPLFQEKMWIYCKSDTQLNIKELEKISKTRPIKIGFTSKKGYSYNIFKKTIKFLNVNISNSVEVEANYQTLIQDFKNNELDFIVSFSLPLESLDTLLNTQKMYLSYQDAYMIEKRFHNVFATNINEDTNQYSLGSWSFLIGTKTSIKQINNSDSLFNLLLIPSPKSKHKRINKIINKSANTFLQNKNNENLQLKNLPLSSTLSKRMKLKAINWIPLLILLFFIFFISIIYNVIRKRLFPYLNVTWLWHRYKHFQLGTILLFIVYFSSIELMIYAEKLFYQNLGIKSPLLNMTKGDLNSWLLITTITGNSNGIFPLSLLGKVMLALNSLNFWIGTILIGISEYLSYNINKKRTYGNKTLKSFSNFWLERYF